VSNKINDGGPAYPVSPEIYNGTGLCGMTLRDFFAAAALQGLMADGGGTSWDDDAKAAYRAADAMIKAREVKP
jgi:hypothetical protein